MPDYLNATMQVSGVQYTPTNMDHASAIERSRIQLSLTLIWAKAMDEGGDFVEMLYALIDGARWATGDPEVYKELCFLTYIVAVRRWPGCLLSRVDEISDRARVAA